MGKFIRVKFYQTNKPSEIDKDYMFELFICTRRFFMIRGGLAGFGFGIFNHCLYIPTKYHKQKWYIYYNIKNLNSYTNGKK